MVTPVRKPNNKQGLVKLKYTIIIHTKNQLSFETHDNPGVRKMDQIDITEIAGNNTLSWIEDVLQRMKRKTVLQTLKDEVLSSFSKLAQTRDIQNHISTSLMHFVSLVEAICLRYVWAIAGTEFYEEHTFSTGVDGLLMCWDCFFTSRIRNI